MAKDSLFVDREQPAKASVVLKLRGQPAARRRPPSAASPASSPAASSRCGPSRSSILDTFGRPLSRPADDGDARPPARCSSSASSRSSATCRPRSSRCSSRSSAPGRVRVNVVGDAEDRHREETEERWDPTAVRPQPADDVSGNAAPTAACRPAACAGARANQPPALSTRDASAATPPAAPATPARRQPTPARERRRRRRTADSRRRTPVDDRPVAPGRARPKPPTTKSARLTRHTVSPQGQLARLSVAVILDDERVHDEGRGRRGHDDARKPWEPAGIQRIQGLVAAAVGLDTKRGDQLTVENIAFEVPPAERRAAGARVRRCRSMDIAQGSTGRRRCDASAILLHRDASRSSASCGRSRGAPASLAAAPALPAPAVAAAAAADRLRRWKAQIEAELDAAGGPGQAPAGADEARREARQRRARTARPHRARLDG